MPHSTPSRVVSLLHVCPLRRLASIRRRGLDPAFARGPVPVVWLVSPQRRRWAVAHVLARHAARAVVVLRLRLPRAWIARRRRGVWVCSIVIPPAAFVSVSLPAFAGDAA